MSNQNFILGYVEACGRGSLPFADCGPVWQLGAIAGLLILAIAVLAILRWRADSPAVS